MAYRHCLICNSDDPDFLFQEDWPVVGVGNVEIGFCICKGCGFVYQNPLVPETVMKACYENLSNYTNPSRAGMPTDTKRMLVQSQLDFINPYIERSARVLQIGSSDGYTLSQFKSAGCEVKGVEPSTAAAHLAWKLYGVATHNGFFEEYEAEENESHDLIVMTHVLEHIYDPESVLRKCADILSSDGLLYIEVPALVGSDAWSPTYFSFEHVSYFSPLTLRNLLAKSGFNIVGDVHLVSYKGNNSALRCVAKPMQPRGEERFASDYHHAAKECFSYVDRNMRFWSSINELVNDRMGDGDQLVVWGAGIHTSQLFSRTDMLKNRSCKLVIDSDPQKHGKSIDGIPVVGFDECYLADPKNFIVISTYAGEAEVMKFVNRFDVAAKVMPLYS